MERLAQELTATVERARERLLAITEQTASNQPSENAWNAKQIIGHLIDSAANNHQRFVRMQTASHLDLPGYDQECWVTAGEYARARWADLVELWALYNQHMARILAAVPEEAHGHTIRIGEKEPLTLAFVAEDYLRHLKHHLDQLESRVALSGTNRL